MRFMRMIIKSILYGAALLLPISMTGGSANAEGGGPVSSKTQYAVATANRDATDVGMRILATGGSAADAAVAIQMVLGVVEPQSSALAAVRSRSTAWQETASQPLLTDWPDHRRLMIRVRVPRQASHTAVPLSASPAYCGYSR